MVGGPARADWEWVKWLPHAQNPNRSDAVGSERLVVGSLGELENCLQEELVGRQRFTRNAPPVPDQPQVIVIVDGGDVSGEERILLEEGLAAVTVLDLSSSLGTLAARRGLRLVVTPEGVGARSASGVERFADPDAMTVTQCEALARRLAPFRIGAGGDEQGEDPLLSNVGFMDLLGLPDAMTFDVAQAWRPRPLRDRLRVPVGVGEHGELVELDIKESAQEGMARTGCASAPRVRASPSFCALWCSACSPRTPRRPST